MKCLIIGFENIEKIHSKYLSIKDIDWYYLDPIVKSPKDNKIFKNYD